MAKNINRKVTIYVNGKEVQNTIGSIRSELKKLENQQRKATLGSEEYIRTTSEIKKLRGILEAETQNINRVGREWKSTVESAAEYSNVLMGIQSAFQMLDMGIGKVKDLAADAAKMDDALGMVMKTTGLTHEQVEKLNESFKKMDTRTSREQLNDLAYQAGKLGFNTEEAVKGFVEAADVINVALGDVLGDDATLEIAKLAEVYSQSTDKIAQKDLKGKMLAVGSAVNQLGKESTASEAYMVDFLGRLGGVATQAGISADQILGYASALDQNKQKLEMSATAFQKLIQQMIKKPQEFLEAARMPLDEFRNMMDTDMNGAILRVLDGFNKMGGLTSLVPVFKDMGLDGARAASVMASLAASLDKVNVAQATASEHIMLANSMNKEYITMNNTMEAQREKALKAFNETRLALGDELYPVLISLQRSGTVLMKGFAGLIQLFKEYPGIIAPITAAILALNKARLVSAAIWLKERPAAIAEWWQRRQNNKAILDETAALAKERVEKVKSLQQRIKERIAIQESIIARRQELVAAGQGNQVLKAEANLRRLKVAQTKADTLATEAQTAATKASAAAIRTIPLMMLVSALAAIGAKLVEVWKHHQRFKKEEQETEKAIRSEAAAAEYLFGELEKTKKGTEEYKKILEKLNELYPEILRKYDLEKGGLNDIRNARQEVIDKIREQIVEQRKLDKISSIAGDFAEKQTKYLQKIREYLISEYGEGEGQQRYERVRDILPSGYNKKIGYKNDINIKELYAELEKASGIDIGELFGWDKYKNAVGDYINAVNEAFDETQNFEALYNGMGAKAKTDDPYGIAGKNLEDLQKMLKKAQEDMQKLENAQASAGTQSVGLLNYSKLISDQQGRINALTDAINKMKDAQKGTSGNGSGDDGTISPSTKETPAEKRARLAQEAWQRFEAGYNRLLERMDSKSLSGAAKVVADVDNAIRAMEDSLQAVIAKHPEAKQMLDDMRKKAAEWKQEQLNVYIQKMTDEFEKFAAKEKEADKNQYIQKAKDAAQQLSQQFLNIDKAISQAVLDADALTEQMNALADNDPERERLQKQIDKLNELIKKYNELKLAMQRSVFDRINTGDTKATSLSGDESQWSTGTQSKVNAMQSSGLGMLFDKSAFESYGRALENINKKYEKQKEKIQEAKEGNEEILMQLLDQQRAGDWSGDLQAKIDAREQEIQRLEQEQTILDQLKTTAEEAAEQDSFGKAIDKWITGLETFGQQAMQLWGSINTIINNAGERRLKKEKERYDEESKALQQKLDDGIISQEEYDEKKEKLDQEYDDKEKEIQKAAWERQKALNIGQAVMEGALAVLKALSSAPPPYNTILAGISGALAAVQIATIATEPSPYAKGGFVNKKTYMMAGEAGREWVASNSLLTDGATAPIIDALEDYQRGNRRALEDIGMAQLRLPAALAASEEIGRNHVVVNPPAVTVAAPSGTTSTVSDPQLLSVMRELATYMKDPKNRQAIISRQTMEDFEKNEDFLRNMARL